MHCCGRGGNGAPDDHNDGEVDCRLADLVEEEIRGDLHEDVADEEDADGSLNQRLHVSKTGSRTSTQKGRQGEDKR